MNKISSILCGCITVLVSVNSWAAIVSVSGDMTQISSPASVAPGMLESSSTIWAFDEKQQYTLTTDLFVDELAGTSAAGTVSAGSTVNSYFLHADPLGGSTEPADVISMSGTISFDSRILGIIWSGTACDNCPSSSMFLDASDYLGASGTIYPTGGLGRGYEIDAFYAGNGTQDFVTISEDGYSLTMVSSAALPLRSDQLRVITAVPIPLSVYLFTSGLFVLFNFARKSRS